MPKAVADKNPSALSPDFLGQWRVGFFFNPEFSDMIAPPGCWLAPMIIIDGDCRSTLH